MSHLEAITIHAERPGELARFWSALLDLPIDPADAVALEEETLGETEAVLLGRRDGLHVWLSPAGELPPPGARIHLDIGLGGPADLDRLAELGAVPRWDDPAGRWRVFADPEGNLFCAVVPRGVSTGPPETLPDSPAADPERSEEDVPSSFCSSATSRRSKRSTPRCPATDGSSTTTSKPATSSPPVPRTRAPAA